MAEGWRSARMGDEKGELVPAAPNGRSDIPRAPPAAPLGAEWEAKARNPDIETLDWRAIFRRRFTRNCRAAWRRSALYETPQGVQKPVPRPCPELASIRNGR